MTKEQLKQNAAAMLDAAAGKIIQCRNPNYPDNGWADLRPCNASWDFTLNTYRPKPEPVSRPWTASDVPPLCWLKWNAPGENPEVRCDLVTSVDATRLWVAGSAVYISKLHNYLYSTDLKQWSKCEVTEPAQ